MGSRLILIEGLPGAGKSSTAEHIGKYYLRQGISCEWFLEEDEAHPLDFTGLALKDLSKQLIPLWGAVLQNVVNNHTVTIIESRLWQNTSLFMYMAEFPVGEIIELQDRVNRALGPASPILIYLYQADVEEALGRLYELRDDRWMGQEIKKTSRYPWFQSRGKDDFSGWLEFFGEWLNVVDELYSHWPYQKLKVENPHDDWGLAYSKIEVYLRRDDVL